MNITLQAYGPLTEIVHHKELEVPEHCSVAAVMEVLYETYPPLRDLSFRISLGNRFANEADELSAGDELGLLPPFSGG